MSLNPKISNLKRKGSIARKHVVKGFLCLKGHVLACNFGCLYLRHDCWIYDLLFIPYGPVVRRSRQIGKGCKRGVGAVLTHFSIRVAAFCSKWVQW
ncbi:hypothetical protein RchiOBHm_Chr4g0393531 [Rosa chinensis]|uniref:Uncharacterized protein n=1 Tax=Rosa chinensis TaxID=74649 RepID=A0A2P6QR11_ROSCH|nr:hypothetical protein RchiOBHm_Chr4g0393531 [Rosa chinensis]